MSNPQPPVPPSAELQALTHTLVSAIQESGRQQSASIMRGLDSKIDDLKLALERKIERLRDEIKEDMDDIRQELADQSVKMSEHAEAIASIEARLNEGDRRFGNLEKQTEKTGDKGAENSNKISELGARVAIGIGTGAAGGAAVGAAMSVFGGH